MNRPARKNAITGPMGAAMTECLAAVGKDPAIQALLLRGADGAFCSGLDLTEFNADPAPDWLSGFQATWRATHRSLFECRVPIVGALERYAINGGAALALACDLLVVGETAFLQVGEIRLGMAAPYNLAWLALRHPEQVSARLALLGRRFDGRELLDLGVATECVPDAQVLAAARAVTESLAGCPTGAGARIKTGMRAHLETTADAWFDRFTGSAPSGAPSPERL